jgi:transcriptional regulator GlxA family with amidase domain
VENVIETRDKPVAVGLLGYDGVGMLDLSCPLGTFALTESQEASRPRTHYELTLIAVSGRRFVSDAGAVFQAGTTLQAAPPLDTVIIPGGWGINRSATSNRIAQWIRERAPQLRRIVCVSTGISAVASTGLLDSRHVTTHWRFAPTLAQRYPKLRLNYTASFVKDGPFYSCGGGMAAMEMTVSLVEEDYGAPLALAAARELLIELKPPCRNEAPALPAFDYELTPLERLADLPAWIVAHLTENLSVDRLADRASLSNRHFARLFKQLFNLTPADLVEQLRLEEARRRLLWPRYSVKSIAASVGFQSHEAFCRVFHRRFGLSPRAFREQELQKTRELAEHR